MTTLVKQPQAQPDDDEPKLSIVAAQASSVVATERIVRFRGRALILDNDGFPHFTPLHRERFDRIAYPLLGGQTRSRMADIFAYIANTAEDLTAYEDLVLFGDPTAPQNRPRIWNMATLEWDLAEVPEHCVWRCPFPPVGPLNPDTSTERIPFIMSLAGDDPDRYDDIMQSMAPLVMRQKPDGVVWWVGDGANGKSTLMDAIYRLFPGQLSSLTVKNLTDGRDTPSLNGTLANIVKESSEGRIEDTEIYKSIGTHENFRVHKFHSQDSIEVQGNIHHIFSANNIPTLNDKGHSARRRTFVVPFSQRFESDPTFEQRTFRPDMFGQIIIEITRYAKKLREQGYRYKWSADTLAAKTTYDAEANNAEEYARELISEGVVAFESFNFIQTDYENWCRDMGYLPLGVNNMRRAIQTAGFDKASYRDGDHVRKHYRLATAIPADLVPFSMGRRPGMSTMPGFAPPTPEPEPTDEGPKQSTLLEGRW